MIKEIIDRVKHFPETLEKKMLESTKKMLESTNGIIVAKEGCWFNTRYDYAEVFGGGMSESEGSIMRYARMPETYITVAQKGKMTVKSDSQGDFECDTILRSNNRFSSCKHLYFNEGNFTGLYRKFTPSMGGGTPTDKIVDYCKIEDIVKYSQPLIRRMEIEVGRKLVNFQK